VLYILTFVSVKAGMWGFHVNFSSFDAADGVPGIMSLDVITCGSYFKRCRIWSFSGPRLE